MNQELTKEIIKKLMEIKGEAKGVTFKTDAEHILKEKGDEGLKRLEAELESLGCPIKYQQIKAMAFLPGRIKDNLFIGNQKNIQLR
jgi:hypothetical protein